MKPTLTNLERRIAAIENAKNPPLIETELRISILEEGSHDKVATKEWTVSTHIHKGIKSTTYWPADFVMPDWNKPENFTNA